MQTFKDSKERSWTLNLSYLKLKELDDIDWSDLIGFPSIHIMRPHDEVFLEALENTPIMLELIWHIVKDQNPNNLTPHKTSGIEQEYDPYLDFAASVGANTKTIEAARNALYKELEDFFPSLATTRKRYSMLLENLTTAYSEMTPETMRKAIENTAENNGTKSTESAELQESIGDPAVKEN